jgi:hypothetical protein
VAAPSGFELTQHKSGEVVITHGGKTASVLRGKAADKLLQRVDAADELGAQHVMARATGNYRRGNERSSR